MISEPVLVGLAPALVTGALAAIANVLRAFGIGDITQEQIDALNSAVVPVMLVLAAIGAWWARRKSTPSDAPRIAEGTTVTVVTPPGEANRETVV